MGTNREANWYKPNRPSYFNQATSRGLAATRCRGSAKRPGCGRLTIHPLGLCNDCFSATFGRGKEEFRPRWDNREAADASH